jgi:hypothetical protein
MTNALFIFALLCALAGAWRGNRTAWALVTGSAVAAGFVWADFPFNPAIWFLIDIAIIAAISATARAFSLRDTFVVLLFLPSWALYFTDELWAVRVTDIIVSAQLLLTGPWEWVRQVARKAGSQPPDETSGFSRVAHV